MSRDDAAYLAAGQRWTEDVLDLLEAAALRGLGVHVVTGVPHPCWIAPPWCVIVEQRPSGPN